MKKHNKMINRFKINHNSNKLAMIEKSSKKKKPKKFNHTHKNLRFKIYYKTKNYLFKRMYCHFSSNLCI